MKIGKTLYVENGKKWRSWLSKNHKTKSEIWLIYYRKETGKPRIPYDDAVSEALCYGWIDSIVKKIDKERFAQRFSPRKPKSVLSQMNKERIRKLIKEKKMTKWGIEAVAHAFNPKTDKADKFTIPLDIYRTLRANKDAWRYFQKMPASYQRIRIAYVEGYRKRDAAMYKKSLAHFIKMTARNKRIGFVPERRDVDI
ncbi:MAG: YdeI/OmpD-associated family protein [Candidatus Pacebacteria bacterium]|nr:YdeI/OmpD-associated family protein [Candidatus Paceibacterota bacterium]